MAILNRKIQIVCTCRAPELEPWRIGFILEASSLNSPAGERCSMMRDAAGQGTGYRLRCGRCPRAPEFTIARWAQLVAGLDQAGVDTLDISALPF